MKYTAKRWFPTSISSQSMFVSTLFTESDNRETDVPGLQSVTTVQQNSATKKQTFFVLEGGNGTTTTDTDE